MRPVLTLSLSVNCTLADLNRQQIYMLPLVSLTMPLNRWRQLKQNIRSVVSDIRQSVMVAVAVSEVAFKSAAWGARLVMNTGTFYSRVGNGIADYLWQELRIRPNIHYCIKSSEEGPRVLSLFVVISPSYLKKINSITEQLSMAAGLGRDINIRIERGAGGALIVEIPKPRELWFDIAVSSLPRRKGLHPVVGLDISHL